MKNYFLFFISFLFLFINVNCDSNSTDLPELELNSSITDVIQNIVDDEGAVYLSSYIGGIEGSSSNTPLIFNGSEFCFSSTDGDGFDRFIAEVTELAQSYDPDEESSYEDFLENFEIIVQRYVNEGVIDQIDCGDGVINESDNSQIAVSVNSKETLDELNNNLLANVEACLGSGWDIVYSYSNVIFSKAVSGDKGYFDADLFSNDAYGFIITDSNGNTVLRSIVAYQQLDSSVPCSSNEQSAKIFYTIDESSYYVIDTCTNCSFESVIIYDFDDDFDTYTTTHKAEDESSLYDFRIERESSS